ncbi:MAG: DUF3343 domain-containing protein [Clostridia bacterium]|nr:DUF3343 domain-containing protein [Clostridia bacterium]
MRLITFFTQAGAIRYEKQLRVLGGEAKLKPVPRQLSSSCGLCLETSFEALDRIASDEIDSIYRVTSDGFELEWKSEE